MAKDLSPYELLLKKLQNSRTKLDKEMSKDIAKAYRDAFIDSYKDLEKMIETSYNNGGEAVEDLILAKVEYVRQINNASAEIIKKYKDLQCKEYTDAYMAFFNSTLPYYEGSQFMKKVRDNINITNKRILQIMDDRKIYKDNFGLSDRIWGSSQYAGDKLHNAIMSCLAQGKGPADIAKTIQQFGTEGHKIWSRDKIKEKLGSAYANQYSGGLDYCALRLARTTMTHLHQLQVIKSNEFNPYVGKVKYHSVHAVGRTCDLCIERDGQVYDRKECPLDHPNGMCWLEPVFCDSKGNIMSAEDIGKDIGKWIRGEKNTGTMDKIKAYKDLPLKDRPKKVKPEKEKPKKEKPEKEKPKKETTKKTTTKKTTSKKETTKKKEDTRFKDYLTHFNNLLAKSNNTAGSEYVTEVTDVLKTKFPKAMQDGYLSMFTDVLKWTQDNSGGFWQPATGRLQFNIKRTINQARDKGRGKYDVWFHETGHAMDSILARRLNDLKKNRQAVWNVKPLSAKKSFIDALYTDLENQRLMVKKKYLLKAGEDLSNYTDEQIHEILPDSELQSIYYDLLARNNKTAGIQDVLEGLTNCKIRIRWGHGKEYWNRNNRNQEVASEAWANFLGSYSDDETNELMKEYFPTAMKEQEKIIKKTLKDIEKAEKESKK